MPWWRKGGTGSAAPLQGVTAMIGLALAVAACTGLLGVLTVESSRPWLGLLAAPTVVLVLAFAWLLRSAGAVEGLPHSVLDASPVAHLVTDGVGDVEYANPACRLLLPGGKSPFDVLRANIVDVAGRASLDRLRSEAIRGDSGHVVLRVHVDGRAASLDVGARKLPLGAGRVLWQIDDVTEAEIQRRALEQDRASLRALIDQAPVGLFSLDQAGRFAVANEMFAGWLGLDVGDLVRDGLRLQDFVWSDSSLDRTGFDAMGPAEGIEFSLRGVGGMPVDVRLDQAVLGEGVGRHTASVLHNLQAERLAAGGSSRERFQRFFELAPVGIGLIDVDGRFKESNKALDELLTESRERVLGHVLLDYIAEGALAEVKARLAAISAGQQAVRPIETRLRGPSEKTVALFVSRLETAERSLVGLILHFIDLSEQKKLEVQFAQSQKMQAVGQLAGGVAHDFNNLLTAMIGFCDLLLLRFRPGDQSFADIMQIKQNANRAANLVRQLLAFSRQQTLQPRVIQIGEVLAELSHLLNRLLGENVELKMIHGRNLGPVRVDQGQLEQVIINLAVNARDAMVQGGTLTIRTANLEIREPFQRELEIMPSGAYVMIEVTDNGTGIPREIMGRIFEPFFSTKEVGSGTGLGLSTVYGIVKQTGGFIFVDSEIGKGTKFSIYLPRHDEVETAAKARADVTEPRLPQDLTGAGTVLLVEDEDPVRMFSARALRNKGYTVLEAKSGEAALKIITDGGDPIDLIITDVVMPRMDGPTLIKHVRETLPDVKVIFISGYTEDTFRKRLDNEQGIHFLPKPFSLKQLATKAKEIMTGTTAGA